MTRQCIVDDCSRTASRRKMCGLHYQRWRKHGDVNFCLDPSQRNFRHGHSRQGVKLSSEYTAWSSMITRCYYPKHKDFKDYGGRGIIVCERWKTAANFIMDMGQKPSPCHSLDRINSDGNYEPDNCRWATPLEQSNNRRNNRRFEFQGKRQTLSQWAREFRLRYGLLQDRIDKYGWSIERALTTPVKRNGITALPPDLFYEKG